VLGATQLELAVIDAGADWIYSLATTGKLRLSTVGSSRHRYFLKSVVPGQQTSVYNQIKAAAFAAPTPWAAVQLRSTTNVSALTGEQSIDGVTTSTSRVLLTAQTDASENGIYVTASGAWARAADADASADFEFGKTVTVTAGTAGAGTNWYYTGADDPTVGTADLTFALVNPAPAAMHLVIS
jgi:hypothetical protein